MDSIVQADQSFFLYLNGIHSPFWDTIMVFFSGKLSWLPLYLLLIGFLIKERKKKVYISLIVIILLVVATDQISVFIKDSVQRPRPCRDEVIGALAHIVKGCGGKFGFVSSHAANTFGVAIFFALFFRKNWVTVALIFWAAVVSYSRIYLGVHYPGDVLGGTFLGLTIGYSMFYLEAFIISRVKQ
jgi:undecaprenyl-diphosphatase